MTHGEEILVANLPLIERVIRWASRRGGLAETEVDDFSSWVKLKLIENDYAILEKFEGRCSLSTYLTIVIQRLLSDYRNHIWGKWRPSARAGHLGPLAVRIEMLVSRDQRSPDEAFLVLQESGVLVTRAEFDEIVAAVGERRSRPRAISLDEVASSLSHSSDGIEEDAWRDERAATASRIGLVLRRGLAELTPEDRTILRLHFDGGMKVSEVARSLALDQKRLYRRINWICSCLREHLVSAGIDANRADEIIGHPDVLLEFGIREVGNSIPGPSLDSGSGGDAEDHVSR